MDGLRGVNRAFSLGDPSALLALRNLHKITASNLNTRGGLSNRRPSLLWVIFDQVQRGLPVGLFRLAQERTFRQRPFYE
jgi:hypothetical protein